MNKTNSLHIPGIVSGLRAERVGRSQGTKELLASTKLECEMMVRILDFVKRVFRPSPRRERVERGPWEELDEQIKKVLARRSW